MRIRHVAYIMSVSLLIDGLLMLAAITADKIRGFFIR